MTPAYSKLIQSLQQKQYAPVYLVDGEEPYYIDRITEYFENRILQPAERDFNLIVLYGKDVSWTDVVNSCRRFPMFAERQVVILKDAAQLKEFGNLAGYLEQPAPTTILLIEHRFKKADGRSKVTKLAKDKGIHFTSEKVKEEQIPAWIQSYGTETGLKIESRESELLASHLGNDLQKIANEIEKVRINIPEEPALTAAHIERYIGINRDYNIFEFADVLTGGNKDKLYKMLSYFIQNAKAAPMALVTGSLYAHFSKLYLAYFLQGAQEKDAAARLGTFPSRARALIQTSRRLSLSRIEYCLLLIGKYNANSVGIQSNAGNASLLKELTGRLELALAS